MFNVTAYSGIWSTYRIYEWHYQAKCGNINVSKPVADNIYYKAGNRNRLLKNNRKNVKGDW